MKSALIIIAGLFALITGCKKSQQTAPYPTQVSGRVLEYGTNKPVIAATVYLLGPENGSGLGGNGRSTLANYRTDSSGKFTFPLKNESHVLYAEAQNFWPGEMTNLVKGSQQDVILDPVANLIIHIKNVNPYDDSDAFGISGLNQDHALIYGKDVDKDLYGTVIGNTYVKIYWGVNRNHKIGADFNDSIYCAAHKTTKFEIKY